MMMRVLIVDDEAPARDRMRHLLEGGDVDVVGEAADGDEALAAAARLAPDVLFLDIQMPGCSGLELAARLPVPRPRIVFCTAFDRFAIDAFEHHAVDYLLKPVNRERLARTLSRLRGEIAAERRVRRERDDAARTQAALMRGDASSPLVYAARCDPAGDVGGDYFDVLRAGARTILAVGDVSGKGLYAGILAAAVQARMQALTARGVHDAATLLLEVNALTQGTLEAHRYVTLALAVHDAETATLTFASAGHPPPLVRTAAGWRVAEAGGPPIGWPTQGFETTTMAAEAGDVVVLYSDGLSEATSPEGDEFGAAGLLGALEAAGAAAPGDLLQAVMTGLGRFTAGAPPADDRTLLVAAIPPRRA